MYIIILAESIITQKSRPQIEKKHYSITTRAIGILKFIDMTREGVPCYFRQMKFRCINGYVVIICDFLSGYTFLM